MTRVLERLAGAGTGPRRLRATLRRDTAAVRATAAAHRSLAEVRYRLPETLLGGDLANWMGESLRRALRFWEPVPAALDAAPRRARGAFTSGASAPASRARLAAGRTASGTAAPAPAAASTPSGARSPREWNTPTPRLGDRAVRARETGDDMDSGRTRPDSASLHQLTGPRRPATRVANEISARISPVPHVAHSPLARALSVYWRGRQTGEPAVAPLIGVPPASVRMAPFLPATSGGEASRIAALPPTSGDTERATASRRGSQPDALTRARAATSLRDQGADADPLPPYAAWRVDSTAADWLTGDLADQLADILREQAIREGVDLT